MRWVTAHLKSVLIQEKPDEAILNRGRVARGFEASITRRAVHELLFQPTGKNIGGNMTPLFPALLAAREMIKPSSSFLSQSRKLVWVDSTATFYPPAAMMLGISPQQLYVLRPQPADLVWATIESLRCRSISAVVALITQPLTRVQVRRLQLAAETGGGVAILVRPNSAASHIYAAATRWLVSPVPGERTIQRWRLERMHGHGGQIGQSFILEKNRASGQTHFVHLPAALADRPAIPAAS